MEKKNFGKVLLVAILVIAVVFCIHSKNSVNYLDYACPICGSTEVGDMGMTEPFGQHGHCFNCEQDFYIEDAE